ncbi:MAG: hypothetical protein U1F52_21605 [Burkholderiales bacterium]
MLKFWKQSQPEAAKPVDPKSAKATLFAGCPIPAFAKESDVVSRLESISGERNALHEARNRTLETIETARADIERIDAERVERMADFAGLDPSLMEAAAAVELADRIEQLRVQLEGERRRVADAERVSATLQSRIDAFDAELNSLRQRYAVEIGHLLDAVFSHLAAQYMSAAPALAEILLQLAAVQDVMMHFRSGNSNGFDRRGYLPTVAPGSMGALRPLVDCSQGLGPHTEAHRKAIIDSLGAIGYRWRFEG